ncbi:heat shock protein [Stella humosa]|uniref:Heat shock protein n=1 Tax=Stella humosa TaxID=94 RepID=A0A3N1KS07_9PROT|nr:M48 family metallopeptidase [Stella humosa]ROP84703.1 heat shock protein [Stella humosa]BBK34223.1 protease HtpX [Stella humosa]
MIGTIGLKTHLWNNAARSILLLAGFPLLLLLIAYAIALLIEAGSSPSVAEGLAAAGRRLPVLAPIAVAAALAWFAVAWFANARLVTAMTGARMVTRRDEPRLHALLETLCIARGLPMPRLGIIETDALNAYAAGVTQAQQVIVVTRGLLTALDEAEVEAVLAHELSHIRHGDVRMLMVATVFVGIISLLADLVSRGWRHVPTGPTGGTRSRSGSSGGSGSGGSSSSSRKGNAGAAIVLVLIAVACIFAARMLAVAIRFALSRRREFMADAGAVELTRDPDAMIAALRKIEGRSAVAGVPDDLRAMFIDDGAATGFFQRLTATHPSIGERVAALVAFAGGRDPGPRPAADPLAATTILKSSAA